jgi:hypothetical protein
MKIFISWSGERSRLTAELLNNWIQCVLQAVDPWLSSKDIDRGSLWFTEITSQLSNTHNGIVCLTKSNLNQPWILFESGALAKGLSSNRVYTFLVDLQPEEVKDPLAQFNHTKPNKDSIYQLIRTINNGLEKSALSESILSNVFETYWPQFEKAFAEILKSTTDEEIKEKRPKDDLLNEILYSVRGIDRRLRRVESSDMNFSLNDVNKTRYYNNNKRIDFKLTPIEDLDLSVRAIKNLKNIDIQTLGDVMKINLKKFETLDNKTISEVREIVENVVKSNKNIA